MSPKKSAGRKAALTRKRRAAAKKAVAKRKHRAAGIKAAAKHKHRATGNKAAKTRVRKAAARKATETRARKKPPAAVRELGKVEITEAPAPTVPHVPSAIDRTEEPPTVTSETSVSGEETSDPSPDPTASLKVSMEALRNARWGKP